jgi:8-oxo-dGTP pyrophosphatase MutT (NUDIX family)
MAQDGKEGVASVAKWDILHRQNLFSCSIFDVQLKQARSGLSGKEHNFFVLHNPVWVNVLPVTQDGEVILIRQYRLGQEDFTLEIPGGLVEPAEDPAHAAQRELLEETGYGEGSLSLLGRIQPNPATHDNWCYSYLAQGVRPLGEQQLDGTEEVELRPTPLAEIPPLIREGEISHSLVLNAFFYYFLQGGLP